jgi:anti-sigma28 factor (negative regulator of flagellin synthesis)
MTVLDIRREPAADEAAGQVGRFRRAASATDRAARVRDLRARVAAGRYDPDPAAVAAAVVERLQRRQCS